VEQASISRLLRFGVFEADTHTGELRKAGRKVGIQEQPFRVLVALLERPGEMLSREELRERVWSADTFIDFDTGLNKAIRKIREVLGDSAESPVYIETLPRRGYRFIAPVETVCLVSEPAAAPEPAREVPPDPSERPGAVAVGRSSRARLLLSVVGILALSGVTVWSWRTSHRPKLDSIAVLPLENLAADPAEEYFADGITDELITELAKIGSLRVISRTSVVRYKRSHKPLGEIARELGANAIVEGTVLRSGDRVRVTAQLIDGARDQHIWAQSYEQTLGDILALQGRVARDIAAHVNARLTGSEQQMLAASRSILPEAHDAYLKGHFFWNKRSAKDARQAIQYFERAVELQPDYAEAYAGIAEAYVVLGWDSAVLPPDDAFPKARAAALKALDVDRSSSLAHNALMWVDLFYQWNWKEAEAEAKEAIRLSPSSVTAHHHYSRLLAFTGRFEEALAESRRSVQLDPLDPIAEGSVAWNSYLARRYDDAIRKSLQMIEMYPSMPGYYRFLGWCYEAQGHFPEALAVLRQAQERSDAPAALADLGYASAASGDRPAASGVLQDLMELSHHQYVPPYYVALVHAGLHENSRAFEWLEKAYREHAPDLVFLLTEPRWDAFRADGRFRDLLARVGFPRAR
jgi:TolB-like protein/DNA-binding winged helix-turn-helix (wHTH) protein/Tfp pilus assembly protein PilF